jgi:hypothetical protein
VRFFCLVRVSEAVGGSRHSGPTSLIAVVNAEPQASRDTDRERLRDLVVLDAAIAVGNLYTARSALAMLAAALRVPWASTKGRIEPSPGPFPSGHEPLLVAARVERTRERHQVPGRNTGVELRHDSKNLHQSRSEPRWREFTRRPAAPRRKPERTSPTI